MPGSEDSRSRSAHAMAPHRWRSARILEAVCQVNEHLVSALIELARQRSVSCAVVAQNLDALCRMDVAACKRAARIPVLLLDLHFQCEDWWLNAASLEGGVREQSGNAAGLSADQAAELTREVLLVAWLAVQETRQSAKLLLGMSNTVAASLGELTPQQLNRVAARSSHELRIRWQCKPEFWQRLFAAASGGIAADLSEIQLLGLQLLGGELMTARGGRRSIG